MYIYSGNCRLCDTGTKVGLKDWCGEELHTGDIVVLYHNDAQAGGLTVVVSDQYTTFSDYRESATYKHVENLSPSPFIMGIKDAQLDEEGAWKCIKVKGFESVIDGEHWPDYGFNYKSF